MQLFRFYRQPSCRKAAVALRLVNFNFAIL